MCGDKDCSESYVGEAKQALKTKVNQYPKPSTNEAQNSAVFLHIKDTDHSFNILDATILDKEEQCHLRGIKEAIWERVEEPSLNLAGTQRRSCPKVGSTSIRFIYQS